MSKKYKIAVLVLVVLIIVTALVGYLRTHNIAVLQPAGQVGYRERQLMIFGLLLSVIVVIPTFALAIFIAVRYREANHKKRKVKYSPDFDHSLLFEGLWWGIPIIIISILSVVAWNSAHTLDPYRALTSNKKPLTIQVVALDWKWLFVYPAQHMASVNLVQFPVNTPINFEITSDTVMNSFWVPNLGGQIYAMPGMSTELHLMADKTGSFPGSSANISGVGFAGMDFVATSSTQADFDKWVATAQKSSNKLTLTAYNELARPSKNNAVAYYSSPTSALYDYTVMKYMLPDGQAGVATEAQ
jgi:cytochrome o ubiquinol oxidase subunit 2